MGTLEVLKSAAKVWRGNGKDPRDIDTDLLQMVDLVGKWEAAGCPPFEADTARIAALESELAAYRAEAGEVDVDALRDVIDSATRCEMDPRDEFDLLDLADAYEAKCGEVVRLKGQVTEVREAVGRFHRCELYGPAPDDIARAVRDVTGRAGIYDAIEGAARDLPKGYIIGIGVERGSAGVTLIDEDGEELDVEIHDGDLAAAIREATAKAAGGAR